MDSEDEKKITFMQSIKDFMDKGDISGAEKLIREHQEYVNSDPDLKYLEGALRLAENNIKRAQEIFLGNINRFPEHVATLNNLAVLEWELSNDPAKAIAFAKKAVESDPTDRQALKNLMQLYSANKDKEGQLYVALKLLEIDESDKSILKLVASIYLERNELVKSKYYIDLAHSYGFEDEALQMLESSVKEKAEKNDLNI